MLSFPFWDFKSTQSQFLLFNNTLNLDILTLFELNHLKAGSFYSFYYFFSQLITGLLSHQRTRE